VEKTQHFGLQLDTHHDDAQDEGAKSNVRDAAKELNPTNQVPGERKKSHRQAT